MAVLAVMPAVAAKAVAMVVPRTAMVVVSAADAAMVVVAAADAVDAAMVVVVIAVSASKAARANATSPTTGLRWLNPARASNPLATSPT